MTATVQITVTREQEDLIRSRHMEQKRVPDAKDGCVARRRAAYAAQIAARSTMTTRLGATDAQGLRLSDMPAAA